MIATAGLLTMTVENVLYVIAQVAAGSWSPLLHDDGTLWINIGTTRSGSGGAGGDYNKKGLKDGQPKYKGSGKSSGLKAKDLCGIRLALALRADGWYWRHENHMGEGPKLP